MADNSYERLVTPVHPIFNRSFTVGDCYDIAAITGLNVQDVTGIIIGRTKPNDVIAERLQPYFGKEVVDSLVNNYNPYMFYEYISVSDKKQYRFFQDIKVSDLTVGSCIYTNDDRWIRISHIESTDATTSIYSGGAHIGRFNNKTFFKAMVPKDKKEDNIRDQRISAAEDDQIRSLLTSGVEDENMESRKNLLDSMIKQIKESRQYQKD